MFAQYRFTNKSPKIWILQHLHGHVSSVKWFFIPQALKQRSFQIRQLINKDINFSLKYYHRLFSGFQYTFQQCLFLQQHLQQSENQWTYQFCLCLKKYLNRCWISIHLSSWLITILNHCQRTLIQFLMENWWNQNKNLHHSGFPCMSHWKYFTVLTINKNNMWKCFTNILK